MTPKTLKLMMKNNSQDPFNRILIIDDNEAIHADFEKILVQSSQSSRLDDLVSELFDEEQTEEASLDYELHFASQGQQGYELLKQHKAAGKKFAVAFVDMRMPPGWDGVETIERLWQVDPDLQVVICTAYSDRTWDEIQDCLGRTDKLLVLKKPFDEIEVIQLVLTLSEKRRLHEELQSRIRDLESALRQQESELAGGHSHLV